MVEWVRLSITKYCFDRLKAVRNNPDLDDSLKESWSVLIIGLLDEIEAQSKQDAPINSNATPQAKQEEQAEWNGE